MTRAGTGKTYICIKTMFELNKQYGWSEFIVVVPSIAIREGVQKSFQTIDDRDVDPDDFDFDDDDFDDPDDDPDDFDPDDDF